MTFRHTKKRRNAIHSEKGFTLVEVIISIAALGVICAVLLRLFVVAGDTNDSATRAQEAELMATSTIETLICADTLSEGLETLGFTASYNAAAVYEKTMDEGVLKIYIFNDGNYPGTLYDIRVNVTDEDNVIADISTKKYEASAVKEAVYE